MRYSGAALGCGLQAKAKVSPNSEAQAVLIVRERFRVRPAKHQQYPWSRCPSLARIALSLVPVAMQ